MPDQRCEERAPSNQTLIDLFAGQWTTNLDQACGVSGTGAAELLQDPRIGMAAAMLGRDGRFDGYDVLEIGPLEGAHSRCIEALGADRVTAVEWSACAFTKCLLVKEMLQLRTRFLYGDAVAFLRQSSATFDLIVCVGVLYHQPDPLEMIKQICLHTNRCFVWSHYHHGAIAAEEGAWAARPANCNGFEATYYQRASSAGTGGGDGTVAWMTQADITRAFRHFGLNQAGMTDDQPAHRSGAHYSCAYSRVLPPAS